MPERSESEGGLRERLAAHAEDGLGRAITEILDSPFLAGAVGRALDARGRAGQAQEMALAALGLPSAADIERLTRRLRSVSQRLEGIEDGLMRLERAPAGRALEGRLTAIEERLEQLAARIDLLVAQAPPAPPAPPATPASRATRSAGAKKPATPRPGRSAGARGRSGGESAPHD